MLLIYSPIIIIVLLVGLLLTLVMLGNWVGRGVNELYLIRKMMEDDRQK